ncbi:SET domain-containing protein [Aspergillus stella-maris]|uniref:SET domain-containing protein n=1 Tax=Aspergillus stella-maris TaxID=1810926 RepID=UPI003CCCB9F5
MRRETLPIEALVPFARLYNISHRGVTFRKLKAEDGTEKGGAIVATEDRQPDDEASGNILTVPSNLVLSLGMVQERARYDHHLRDVLEAVGDFGKTARGTILIFLLIQVSHTSPDIAHAKHKIGTSSAWSEYVKFLPSFIPLPTFWSAPELELLRGTSLRLAYDAKILSLEKELDHLRSSTEEIEWCRELWWDEEIVTIEDWKYLDAVLRSRMVDLPGHGVSIVPCVDMANHASDSVVNALYERDEEGNAVLQLRSGKSLAQDEEVTISYGEDKAASEMVFSYGFLNAEQKDAKQMFLDLTIPDDDPLKMAKMAFCRESPGLRIFSSATATSTSEPQSGSETPTTWESPLAWWSAINPTDGLDFAVLQNTDGSRELAMTWKGAEISSPEHLVEHLQNDPLWDIFQLRAVVLVLERLENQFFSLRMTENMVGDIRKSEDMLALFRKEVFETVIRLRGLEGGLLEGAIRDVIKQRDELMTSETVTSYLAQQQQSAEVEDDFS